jgi:phenylalanyl-tRNA synthetase beta chain
MAGIAIEGVERLEDDVILELDLTPNRGDCLGLINLAGK